MRLFKIFTAVCLLVTACTKESGDELLMYLGTYTGAGSNGIYVYSFNQESGMFGLLDSIGTDNPSFVLENDGILYAVNESSDDSEVEAYAYSDGSYVLKGSAKSGADPCHLATNGKLLLSADYSSGTLSVFRTGTSGKLRLLQSLDGSIGGPDSLRQASPHVHCAAFSPDGRYVLASDFSADRILQFKVCGRGLKSIGSVPVRADSGPRHIIFSSDGRFAYVIGELSGEVTAFSFDKGVLKEIQRVQADGAGGRGSADIRIATDGRFLYASNRLKEDGIAVFKRNPGNGKLSLTGYMKTGLHPRNFRITPNGKYLLCACRDSDWVEIYAINPDSGMPEDTGSRICISRPVCIEFAK